MKRSLFRFAAVSALLGLGLVTSAAAQDFQKSYAIGPGGSVHIGTISGNVVVTAYNGNEILVSGFKEGRDRDLVGFKDRSSANKVDVGVDYPKDCRCDAGVRFEVMVPSGVNYNFEGISSVSGDVKVNGVTGYLKASSVSGDVEVREVTGAVSASSVSGDVSVEISRFEGNEDMKFTSVSGDVNVRLPSSLGAEIDMSSLSGSIRTDFPIEVKKERYTSRKSARGTVGDGARSLRISSVSGSLSLLYL